MTREKHQHIRLDLNNPAFQRQLFNLSKSNQRNILNTLRKLGNMTWQQVYSDYGLKWGNYSGSVVQGSTFRVKDKDGIEDPK